MVGVRADYACAEESQLLIRLPPLPTVLDLAVTVELCEQAALAAVLKGSDVRRILSGHVHHPSFGTFAGIPVAAASSSAYGQDLAQPVGATRGRMLRRGTTSCTCMTGRSCTRSSGSRSARTSGSRSRRTRPGGGSPGEGLLGGSGHKPSYNARAAGRFWHIATTAARVVLVASNGRCRNASQPKPTTTPPVQPMSGSSPWDAAHVPSGTPDEEPRRPIRLSLQQSGRPQAAATSASADTA